MKKLKSLMLAVMFIASAVVLSACVNVTVKLSTEDDIAVVRPGGSVQFISETLNDKDKDKTFTYHIVEGEDFATITQAGLLTVNSNAISGDEISVISYYKQAKSNIVVITVGVVDLTDVEIEADTETNIVEGGSEIELSYNLIPTNATNREIEWIVVEGSDYAKIENNILKIDENVASNIAIKVQAKNGEINSNVLTFTTLAKLKVQLILSSEDDAHLVMPGNSLQYETEIETTRPDYIEDKTVVYEIVEGQEFGTISEDGLLTVKSDAIVGESIKVVSKLEDFVSNTVAITVGVVDLTDIEIEADTETNIVEGGGEIELSYNLIPTNATNREIEWIVVEGSDYAKIENNVLKIDENVASNIAIKVQAKNGEINSNVLTFTTLAKLKVQLILSSEDDVELVKPGNSLQFETEIETTRPDYIEDKTVVYEIVEGQEFATITEDGLLTVKSDAIVGESIKVVSKLENFVSNTVVITVEEIALQSITISARGQTQIKRDIPIALNITLNPTNTTAQNIEWQIVSGEEYAFVQYNMLYLNEQAVTGKTIKVVAVYKEITSNLLEFVIAPTLEEIYHLSFVNGNITLDINHRGQQQVLEVGVIDGNFDNVTDKQIDFEVVEGAEFVSLTSDGYSAELSILGHGQAKVRATITGTNVWREANINVIVPPTAISLPSKFNQRIGYEFNYSKAEKLPFEFRVIGEKVAQDFDVTFEKDGVAETTAGQFATYENNQITFNTTGKVKVIATSNSGSRVETKSEYTFNINNGQNVSTFARLKSLIEANTGDLVINITEDIVLPAVFASTAEISITAWRAFKSLTLNGNKYILDASNLEKVPGQSLSELIDFDPTTAPRLYIEGTSSTVFDPESVNKPALQFAINIYDYTMRGNGDINNGDNAHTYNHGLRIGRHNFKALYFLHLDGVTSTGFTTGITIEHAQNGIVENTTVGNNYSTGINVNASIITFRNMTYGLAGATGIEVAPDSNTLAGANFDEKQRVTFEGTISTTNYNDGLTEYLKDWQGGQGMGLVTYNFGLYENKGTPNVYRIQEDDTAEYPNRKFVFIAFVFHNKTTYNYSELIYANADMNGIIDIAKMETFDNVHQYVTMDVYDPSNDYYGKVLLYNQNYGKPQP